MFLMFALLNGEISEQSNENKTHHDTSRMKLLYTAYSVIDFKVFAATRSVHSWLCCRYMFSNASVTGHKPLRMWPIYMAHINVLQNRITTYSICITITTWGHGGKQLLLDISLRLNLRNRISHTCCRVVCTPRPTVLLSQLLSDFLLVHLLSG